MCSSSHDHPALIGSQLALTLNVTCRAATSAKSGWISGPSHRLIKASTSSTTMYPARYIRVPTVIRAKVSHTHNGDDSRGRIVGPSVPVRIQARSGNQGNIGDAWLLLIFWAAAISERPLRLR